MDIANTRRFLHALCALGKPLVPIDERTILALVPRGRHSKSGPRRQLPRTGLIHCSCYGKESDCPVRGQVGKVASATCLVWTDLNQNLDLIQETGFRIRRRSSGKEPWVREICCLVSARWQESEPGEFSKDLLCRCDEST